MKSPAEDIKDMLVADSDLGLTFATNLFIGREPSAPDNCVTVFDTPGFPPALTLRQGENYYYPSVQVRVRNNSYLSGWDLINDIKVSLHARGPETWNSTVYALIRCSQEPALLDWDEHGQARFVATFDVQRTD